MPAYIGYTQAGMTSLLFHRYSPCQQQLALPLAIPLPALQTAGVIQYLEVASELYLLPFLKALE